MIPLNPFLSTDIREIFDRYLINIRKFFFLFLWTAIILVYGMQLYLLQKQDRIRAVFLSVHLTESLK